MLLEEINQLIKDRQVLEKRLGNVIPHQITEDEKESVLLELRKRLDHKDDRISELEAENHHLSIVVERLLF